MVTTPLSSQPAPTLSPLNVPQRLLLGPGPSNVNPVVLAAMNTPPLGHLDPDFLGIMDEIQTLLRYVWQTQNRLTYAISGTGTAAMEATLANAIEPGDRVVVCVKGYFGHRLVDMAQRYGAQVHAIHQTWGQPFSKESIQNAIETHRPAVLAIVHAETSTGVRQPLEGLSDLCQAHGTLLLVDTVTSMGGVPIKLDEWGIDLAYSCSQKGLACPPGASPFTLSDRAYAKLQKRSGKVPNWYLDATLLEKYWGSERVYHHTAPINMYYALREALRLLAEEGIENAWERHQQNAEYLWSQLEAIGLQMHVAKEYRLPTLTTVRIPEGIDGKAIARRLLLDYNIEVGGGLGELGGKVWRIGLMGYNSRPENVDRLLQAFKEVL
ncbi:pyridoxal-phosphate-dependent aminotransferase family protein [Lyngbya confervoides]|uniref:Alanine--glyoxylate aminotransferase family protein n=1 Tax=Lyngbya confervoides BDU141951 TaxID=1574623 RepID=A0ABD4T956_9CYAN|nr:alanine--glyoxylate aminotransferase family protein [Lyngbya confervoides]MCM1985151.1 alanine--glyoxylate aminotransferase family protein [Lyngbya confervoides BDU141951]